MTFMSRAALLTAVASVALGLSTLNSANAGWYNCPSSTHVAYHPVTGRSIAVGYNQEIGQPLERPVWAWVCVDDGGFVGAQSVGHATYLNHTGVASAFQHTLVCPSTQESCVQTFTGVKVLAPTSGQYGARLCVSPVVAEDILCASAGATPGSGIPGLPTVEGPSRGDFCVVDAAGVCALQRVTVRTGGNVATVYVGDTPVGVGVPALCVGTSRPGSAVTIAQGSTC